RRAPGETATGVGGGGASPSAVSSGGDASGPPRAATTPTVPRTTASAAPTATNTARLPVHRSRSHVIGATCIPPSVRLATPARHTRRAQATGRPRTTGRRGTPHEP